MKETSLENIKLLHSQTLLQQETTKTRNKEETYVQQVKIYVWCLFNKIIILFFESLVNYPCIFCRFLRNLREFDEIEAKNRLHWPCWKKFFDEIINEGRQIAPGEDKFGFPSVFSRKVFCINSRKWLSQCFLWETLKKPYKTLKKSLMTFK